MKIPVDSNVVVWFGHSSVFIQLHKKRFLIDPSFSGKASPLPWGTRAYKGSNIYSAADIPAIDYLLISHDHYDIAIMETGQYDSAWHSVHNLPEEVVQTTLDLKVKRLLPVHNSKFTLSKHAWDEPLVKITELSESQPYLLATPMIGETVNLNDGSQVFGQWWKGIR